jgi:glycosyltransferase involved in cell wall biosynthesis/GT2 family glycosyltransferase
MTTEAVSSVALLILGMHRSGTSALAGALSLAGVDLGTRLVPPAADNPKGFFEHEQVWRIHHELLIALGSSWHDVRALPVDWEHGEQATAAAQRLRTELEQDFAGVALWGVKDPRLSRCFALWPGVLASLGAIPRVVLALRDPFEVAASLQKRDGLEQAHALALWLRYTLDAERGSRGLARTVQHYPDLLADWRAELARLQRALAVAWPGPPDPAAIDAFLDPGLRHHLSRPAQTNQAHPFADWCIQAYEAMRQLEARPEESMRTLDAIAREFDRQQNAAFAGQIADHLRQIRQQREAIDFLEGERRRLIAWGQQEQALRLSREGEIAAGRQQLQHERERRAAIQAELDGVYRSRSWRWTKPMRQLIWVTRRIRKGLRQSIDIAPPTDLANTAARPAPMTDAKPLAPNGRALPGRDPVAGVVGQRVVSGRLRLLIVTPDFLGPIRNGGIGTAFAALAVEAARHGFDVTVLYALGRHSEAEPIEHWVAEYARQGVELIPLDDGQLGDHPLIDAPLYRRQAWHVHHWLQKRQGRYDVVIFPEWMGLAFYVLLAKGQGLGYHDLPVLINTHSPEAWAMEGNRQLPEWPDDVDRDFMERECVRRADLVISPSKFMLDWMQSHQWQLPVRRAVLPNLMPHSLQQAADRQRQPTQAIRRVVFFGRLEPRKGLKLFCDAVDRLQPQQRERLERIVFLGKAIATPHGFDSRTFIAQRSAGWGVSVDVLVDRNRDEALHALEQPGTLAVIPSLTENSPYTVLECLTRGIVFIASRVGGIPEMLAEEDRAWHLFDPNPGALVGAISRALSDGLPPARLAWHPDDVKKRWWQLLEESVAQQRSARNAQVGDEHPQPRVSVCLVHYNRPHLLAQALDSLRAQTYGNFEVVLVDDGSPSEAAKTYLDSLDREFAMRDWQMIRQTNRYLGAARNAAARAARGDYLLFMDDDNVATPEMLEVFVRAARNSGADVMTSVNMPFSGETPPVDPERLWLPLGGATGAGLYRNAFGDANALWKRDAFEKVGGYTTDHGVGHEDWELFAEAVLCGLRLEVVAQPLYWYRVNPGGMLRAGDHWADHARSVRPYLRHDPHGLGMALAYALFLQRQRELGAALPVARASLWRAAARAMRLAGDASLRAQFIGAVRGQGLRAALRRALAKAGR